MTESFKYSRVRQQSTQAHDHIPSRARGIQERRDMGVLNFGLPDPLPPFLPLESSASALLFCSENITYNIVKLFPFSSNFLSLKDLPSHFLLHMSCPYIADVIFQLQKECNIEIIFLFLQIPATSGVQLSAAHKHPTPFPQDSTQYFWKN